MATPTGTGRRARRKRARRGTTIRYRLSEAAAVTIGVQRRVRGRRFVRATATLRRVGKAGVNKVRFTGRVRGKRLRRGVHRFVLVAQDGRPEVAGDPFD